jgi:hypothetical protein
MIATLPGFRRVSGRPLLAPDPGPDPEQSEPRAGAAPISLANHDLKGRQRRPAAVRLATIEQFPSAWPNAPEDAQGIARTLSRGLI